MDRRFVVVLLCAVVAVEAAINPKPWLRVKMLGPIEEPASVFLSFTALVAIVPSVIRHFRERKRHSAAAWTAFPYRSVWYTNLLSVVAASVTSVLFHTKDVVWTERADYMAAMTLLTVFLAAAVIRSFGLRSWMLQLPVFSACFGVLVWHFRYMLMVKWDYGRHFRLGTQIAVAMVVMWISWSLWQLLVRRETPHSKWVLASVLSVAVFAPLELLDFRPIWKIFDAHSLWHAALIIMTALYWEFCTQDFSAFALSFEKKQQQQKQGTSGDPKKEEDKKKTN